MMGPKKLDICLTPKSDKHLISPHNIIPESCSKVKRIKQIISSYRSCWLSYKFSLSIPEGIYGEQYGEYFYWY